MTSVHQMSPRAADYLSFLLAGCRHVAMYKIPVRVTPYRLFRRQFARSVYIRDEGFVSPIETAIHRMPLLKTH